MGYLLMLLASSAKTGTMIILVRVNKNRELQELGFELRYGKIIIETIE